MHLHHKVYGSGRPVIILHGLFGMLDNWQWVAKQLADRGYMVYTLDLRNHGRSPHLPEHDYPTMAEDLHDFMLDRWLHRAHVLGHSMGGKVAMHFALEYPDMVDRLIIADIFPKTYQDNHSRIFQALFAVQPQTLQSRQQAETILAQYIEEPDVQQFLLKNLYVNPDTGKYAWKINLEALHRNYADILSHRLPDASFEGAVLFLRGERSDYIDPAEWELALPYFPQAHLRTIAGAGHWVHAEQPAAFLQEVLDFLDNSE